MNLHSKNKEYPNLPILFIWYLFGTIALYSFGPIDWKTHKPILTYFLLISYILAFSFGIVLANSKNKKLAELPEKDCNAIDSFSEFYFKNYIIISVIYICFSLFSIYRITVAYGLRSITDMFEMIVEGKYRELYFTKSEGSYIGGSGYVVLTILFSPISSVFVAFTVMKWKLLTLFRKIMGLIGCLLWFALQLSGGTSRAFFVIMMPLFIGFLFRSNKKKKKSQRHQLFVIVLLFVILAGAFNAVMNNRMKGSTTFLQIGENRITNDGWLYNILPSTLKDLSVWIDFYLCQGYYGFSLCTEVGWVPMFGAGFSRWLCLELSSIISPSIYNSTYQVRIEERYSWEASANWHTAYSWFANDVSLIGVILVMFCIGYLFSRIYFDARQSKNLWSIGALIYLTQMIFFLPCNNLVFSNSNSMFSFFVYIFVFLFRNKKVRITWR